MKNTRRFLAILFAGMFALFAGMVAWLFANEERLSQALLKELDARLTQDAHIGQIELSVWSNFPDVSLVLKDSWIMDSFGQGDTLLDAKEIYLACNAIELWRGRFSLTTLSIADAKIHLKQDADGRWNSDVWRAEGEGGDIAFSIERCSVVRTTIAFDEHECKVDHADVQLTQDEVGLTLVGEGTFAQIQSTAFSTLEPLQWKGKAILEDQSDAWNATLTHLSWNGMSSTLQAQSDGTDWSLEGTADDVTLLHLNHLVEFPQPWNQLKSEARAHGTFSWSEGVFKSTWTLERSAWSVPLDSEGSIDCHAAASIWLKYEGGTWRADVPQIALDAEGAQWSGSIERIQFSPTSFEAKGRGSWDWDSSLLTRLRTSTWPSHGSMDWNGIVVYHTKKGWTMNGSWSAASCAGEWSGTPWEAEAAGTATEKTLTINSLSGTWDKVPFDGSMAVNNWLGQADQTQVTGSLHLTHWNFGSESSDSGAFDASMYQLPPNLRVDCAILIDSAIYEDWSLAALDFQLKGNEQSWSIPRFRASTFDGTLSGDATITFLADGAVHALLHPSAMKCNLRTLFNAFEDFGQSTLRAEHVQGTFHASGSVQFRMDAHGIWDAQSLDVLGSAYIDGGALLHVEAFQEIAEYLRSNRMMAPWVDPDDLSARLRNIQVDHVESPFYVSQGAVQIPTIDIRSSAMDITLEGRYGFDTSIDYTLGFALRDLRNAQDSEFGPIEDDGLGQRFFMAMRGTMDEPEYSWDRGAQRNHRKENFQREKDLLKDLFKKSSP